MRAPLSIVIPSLDSEPDLPALLMALMEGVEADLIRELILSDGGSRDATRSMAEAVGARWVAGPAGWAGQVARGAAEARAEWLLVLPATSVPGPGWVEAVMAGIARGAPGHFHLRFVTRRPADRLAETWINRRAGWFGRASRAQGLLAPRAALLAGPAERLRPRPLGASVNVQRAASD